MGASIDEPQWDNRPILNSAHVVTQPERSAKIYADNVGSIGAFFIFHSVGNFIIPTDENSIFSEGSIPPTTDSLATKQHPIAETHHNASIESPFGSPGCRLNWSPGWTWTDRKPRQSCVQSQWRTPSQVVTKTRGGLRVPALKKKLKSPPRTIPKPKLWMFFDCKGERANVCYQQTFFDFSGVSWMVVAYFTIGVPY